MLHTEPGVSLASVMQVQTNETGKSVSWEKHLIHPVSSDKSESRMDYHCGRVSECSHWQVQGNQLQDAKAQEDTVRGHYHHSVYIRMEQQVKTKQRKNAQVGFHLLMGQDVVALPWVWVNIAQRFSALGSVIRAPLVGTLVAVGVAGAAVAAQCHRVGDVRVDVWAAARQHSSMVLHRAVSAALLHQEPFPHWPDHVAVLPRNKVTVTAMPFFFNSFLTTTPPAFNRALSTFFFFLFGDAFMKRM